MEQSVNWVRRFTDGANLPDEVLPGVSVIELAGDCRVLIERHGGVTEYGSERICIRVSFGCVCVCGCDLKLSRMSREQLVISGRIDQVQLKRGRK